MAIYQRKPMVIAAEQVLEWREVDTNYGTVTAQPSNWLITEADGTVLLCDDRTFQQMYELSPDQTIVIPTPTPEPAPEPVPERETSLPAPPADPILPPNWTPDPTVQPESATAEAVPAEAPEIDVPPVPAEPVPPEGSA